MHLKLFSLPLSRAPWIIIFFTCLLELQFIHLILTAIEPERIASIWRAIGLNWSDQEIVAQIGLLFSSFVFLMAEIHFASIAKTIEFTAKSVTSHAISDFPSHVGEIAEMVRHAEHEVMVLADCVDYGSFRNFDAADKLIQIICEKGRDKGKPKICILVWGEPQPMSRANRYRAAETRQQPNDKSFVKDLNVFLSKLEERESTFVEQNTNLIRKVRNFAETISSDWSVWREDPMNSLLKLQHEFQNYQMTKLRLANVKPILFEAKSKTTPTEDHEGPPSPELLFWVIDNKKAIFILPHHGKDAIAFETMDSHLIARLVEIFEWRMAYALKRPRPSLADAANGDSV